MKGFTLNLLLALTWALLSGRVTLGNLFIGFVAGFLALALFRNSGSDRYYTKRSMILLRLVLYFFSELFTANIQAAARALSIRPALRPAIIAVPLRLQRDPSITTLATIITLFPGTVAMGVSEDRRTLYVHSIGSRDAETARRSIQRVEDALLELAT